MARPFIYHPALRSKMAPLYAGQLLNIIFIFLIGSYPVKLFAQQTTIHNYNIVWNTQSKNSGESMPCGGGDIGLNVWVEKGEVLFYISRSGSFDENNTLLKAGRVRIRLSPNPFEGNIFKQELILKDGNVKINGSNGKVKGEINIWVDVFQPVVHLDISADKKITATVVYENWRYRDRINKSRENNGNSYKWTKDLVTTYKDDIYFKNNRIIFYHRNKFPSVFDYSVKQQGLDHVKQQLFDPLKNLTAGGVIDASNMIPDSTMTGNYIDTDYKGWKLKSLSPSRSQKINIYLHTAQSSSALQWEDELNKTIQQSKAKEKTAFSETKNWWAKLWDKSFIYINPDLNDDNSSAWQMGRNYQLFRYMLGCNAFGNYPTKFNGGLFTYDPSFTDTALKFTPDFRNWGGGAHAAQNQRLIYWPMLKSGDFDMMRPQFEFYLRILKNAELRSNIYWNHKGACFTEQLENFGLPNPAEYGYKRPENFDKGIEYNGWLEYEWDTVLEFCFMMLQSYVYNNTNIKQYIPFIESCLTFFNEHYQYRARQRGNKTYDGNGHLVLYPGSGAETFKMANNATSTISALRTITSALLSLPVNYLDDTKRKSWQEFLNKIPPINFTSFEGHTTISPAKTWERINNTESPQLYPVFPWGIYGMGKPGIDVAINTYKYDSNVVKFRSHVGWKQDNIFAARLGITEDAYKFTELKLKNSGRRFPAFWGPGYDWTPDHNWGGSGMIGLQEMLLQTEGKKIYLFPSWPKNVDVHFKLHAPYQTVVEAKITKGKAEIITVSPHERRKDIVIMY